ncbi:S24 family peptidase [Hydrogenophaga sp.]|nr:S24 family peptidase [Hydrogenophaga sp.]
MAKLTEIVGLASTSSVHALAERLCEAGYLTKVDCRIAPTKRFFARPVFGFVRAGLAQPASQEEPELITVDDYVIDEPNRTTMHRVKGDSMRDAGIVEGDVLAVEHNTPTKPGDIVLACVDNELTVKTLRMDAQGRWYLEPAIPAYECIRPRSALEVLGVVVGPVRRLRH